MVGINVALPREVHRAVKIKAAREGITIKAAVALALEEWVARQPQR